MNRAAMHPQVGPSLTSIRVVLLRLRPCMLGSRLAPPGAICRFPNRVLSSCRRIWRRLAMPSSTSASQYRQISRGPLGPEAGVGCQGPGWQPQSRPREGQHSRLSIWGCHTAWHKQSNTSWRYSKTKLPVPTSMHACLPANTNAGSPFSSRRGDPQHQPTTRYWQGSSLNPSTPFSKLAASPVGSPYQQQAAPPKATERLCSLPGARQQQLCSWLRQVSAAAALTPQLTAWQTDVPLLSHGWSRSCWNNLETQGRPCPGLVPHLEFHEHAFSGYCQSCMHV